MAGVLLWCFWRCAGVAVALQSRVTAADRIGMSEKKQTVQIWRFFGNTSLQQCSFGDSDQLGSRCCFPVDLLVSTASISIKKCGPKGFGVNLRW